jgi:hypothetical protein
MVCAIMQESFDTLNIVSLKAKINIFLTLFATFSKELLIKVHVTKEQVSINVNDDVIDDDSVLSNTEEPAKRQTKSKYKCIYSNNFKCLLNLIMLVH